MILINHTKQLKRQYALKIDDVEVFEYTMPSLSYKDVAYKLQPFSTNAQVVFSAKPTKNSKDSLQKIFDYDAAKCFNFLLEVRTILLL